MRLWRQQVQNRFGQWHLCRVLDGTGVDQKRAARSNEEVKKVPFKVRAKALPENESLGLVRVHLKGWLRSRAAVFRSEVPVHVKRPWDELGPRWLRVKEKSEQNDDRSGPPER